jgi:DNA-binding transcriptional MocR family regulator
VYADTAFNYRRPGGSIAERDAAAAWLRSRVAGAHRDRLVICPGTQTALFNLLITLTKPGDVVLTEALTYPGMRRWFSLRTLSRTKRRCRHWRKRSPA